MIFIVQLETLFAKNATIHVGTVPDIYLINVYYVIMKLENLNKDNVCVNNFMLNLNNKNVYFVIKPN